MGEPQKQLNAEDDRLLSFEETQQRYKRTRGTLYNWLRIGAELPAAKNDRAQQVFLVERAAGL